MLLRLLTLFLLSLELSQLLDHGLILIELVTPLNSAVDQNAIPFLRLIKLGALLHDARIVVDQSFVLLP